MARRGHGAVAAAALLAVSVSGCAGLSSVKSDQEEVCGALAANQEPLRIMLPISNPEGTVGQALFASGAYLQAAAPKVQEVMSESQKSLLDRVLRPMGAYSYVLTTKDPNSYLVDNAGALNSYQSNVAVNYRLMLRTIECPIPDFLAALPSG